MFVLGAVFGAIVLIALGGVIGTKDPGPTY